MSSVDTSLKSIAEQSVQTGAGTVGSLFLAILARVKRSAAAGTRQGGNPAETIERSMSRKPVNEVSSLPVAPSEKLKFNRRGASMHKSDETPQPILHDTMPQVHDRLPDPSRWKIIQENFDRIEDRMKGAQTFQQKSTASRTNSNADSNLNSRLQAERPLTGSGTPLETEHATPANHAITQEATKRRSKRRALGAPQLEGVLRRRQMYCSTGFHIQIMKNGRVSGTRQDHDQHAILEFISMDVGLVSIRGVVSGRYLAMDSKGRLFSSEVITHEAVFREHLQENWYNTYSSLRHKNRSNSRPCLISFGRKSRPRHGCRTNENHRFTHFLPRPVDPEKVPFLYKGILY